MCCKSQELATHPRNTRNLVPRSGAYERGFGAGRPPIAECMRATLLPRASENYPSRQLGEQEPSPARHIPSLGRCFYHYFSEIFFPSSEIHDRVVSAPLLKIRR